MTATPGTPTSPAAPGSPASPQTLAPSGNPGNPLGRTCSAREAHELCQRLPAAQLVDVREFPEFAAGHAVGARLIPLANVATRVTELNLSAPVVLLCKGGARASKAAVILRAAGCQNVTVVVGGTDAWIDAGLPVLTDRRRPWSLERQVRLVAGVLVLAGLLIPPWPWLSACVGAGLAFAALTNTCALASVLGRMPWNRAPSSAPKAACSLM